MKIIKVDEYSNSFDVEITIIDILFCFCRELTPVMINHEKYSCKLKQWLIFPKICEQFSPQNAGKSGGIWRFFTKSTLWLFCWFSFLNLNFPHTAAAGIADTHLRCYDFTIKTFLHTVFRGFDCWLNCNCVELLHLNLDVVFRQNAIDIYFVAAVEPISHSNLHYISHNGLKSRVKEDPFQ